MKIGFNLWTHGQKKSSGPFATQEFELTKIEETALQKAFQTAKQLWRDDVGERDAGQFLADILQNILAKEKNIEQSIVRHDVNEIKAEMHVLNKNVRLLNHFFHTLAQEEKRRKGLLANLFELAKRITELQFRVEKLIDEEE
ncbi:MAG TPA: hypothetical protein HA224_03645 [Nanoarchaeota archaeon]|nr:hypothetical protein [Nanoarchaeota archaeon]